MELYQTVKWTLTIAAAALLPAMYWVPALAARRGLISWMLYGLLDRALPSTIPIRTVDWSLTEDALTLGGQAIPRDTIRQVHCWPNRDALGHSLPGWTVNIETTGKNRVLRSVRSGAEAETSERLLRELVETLGYGACLPEKES